MAINPEQAASHLSMTMYTFLDPIVFLAYRVPHLSHDMLPRSQIMTTPKTLFEEVSRQVHVSPLRGLY